MDENENLDLNEESFETSSDSEALESMDSMSVLDELEGDAEETEDVPEESEASVNCMEEILLEMSSRLENVESVICATPDPDHNFLQNNVSELNSSEGLLFMILLVLLFFLVKDLIGGVLKACIRR